LEENVSYAAASQKKEKPAIRSDAGQAAHNAIRYVRAGPGLFY
jgi:hypothetical protein